MIQITKNVFVISPFKNHLGKPDKYRKCFVAVDKTRLIFFSELTSISLPSDQKYNNEIKVIRDGKIFDSAFIGLSGGHVESFLVQGFEKMEKIDSVMPWNSQRFSVMPFHHGDILEIKMSLEKVPKDFELNWTQCFSTRAYGAKFNEVFSKRKGLAKKLRKIFEEDLSLKTVVFDDTAGYTLPRDLKKFF